MSADSLKDVLSITYDAIRRQFDRLQMSWEDDRTTLLRSIPNSTWSSSTSSKSSHSAGKLTRADCDNVPEQRPALPSHQDELRCELLLAKEEKFVLKQKNEVLKQNFAFLEEKYRRLRMKVAALTHDGDMLGLGAAAALVPDAAPVNDQPLLKRYRSEAAPRSVASVEARQGSKKIDIDAVGTTSRPLPGRPGLGVSPGRLLQRASTAGGHIHAGNTTASSSYVPKFQEVVRKKADRAALPGHACEDCRGFYQTILDQGIINKEQLQECLQDCSRHKSRYAPQNTPPGFWDEERFSMPTPEPQPPVPPPAGRTGGLGAA
jgi:hypothetical protein